MIGLLLKDFYTMRQYLRTQLVLLLFLSVVSTGLDNPATFLTGFTIILSVMLTISSFSYDDLAKWNRYALSLPVSRREIVGGKYLLSVVLCFIGAILSFFISRIILRFNPVDGFGLKEHLTATGAIICAAVFFISLLLPLTFKFGVEKSRFVMIAVFAAPTAGVLALSKIGVPMPAESSLMACVKLMPLLIIFLYSFSYWFSVKIFSGKEI